MQERMDAKKEGCKIGGMLESIGAGKEGCRKGEIQDMRYANLVLK